MPYSTNFFKKETIDFIKRKFDPTIYILDIGAGCGTYADYLGKTFPNIDAVEVFAPYIEKFSLKSKYKIVYNENILNLDIDFSKYSLIILGDVLEHISRHDAITLLKKLLSTDAEIVICVPFNAEQSAAFDNIFEEHLQPDLTVDTFLDIFPEFIPLCVRFDYGVFIRKHTNISRQFPIFYVDITDEDIQKLQNYFPDRTMKNINENTSMTTIVTALWDIGRDNITDGFKRSYQQYKEKFAQLLACPNNMLIYVSKEDEDFIWQHRDRANTEVKIKELSEFNTWFYHFNQVQHIRNDVNWKSQAGWLKDSPQSTLEYYNPIVMSKMFLLNDATIYNPFKSTHFYWIDAGITSTVNYGYFTHDKVLNNIDEFYAIEDKFIFISYPYETGAEIHGFPRTDMNVRCGVDNVGYVCRGGFFGGKAEHISKMNGYYYSILHDTLTNNLMGTEESIFTIMAHKYHDEIFRFEIEGNGLVWPFFETLKNVTEFAETHRLQKLNKHNIALYVLTYNSPNQFKTLCESFQAYDNNFLDKPIKFLINNSTNLDTDEEYANLCETYGFTEIKKDNIGICGGRQFIAEHSDSNGFEYYFFFEDDMNFYTGTNEFCKNGFRRKIPNFYDTMLAIEKTEQFDFLKFNFSEFYGDNTKQWAWYNVPQDVRESLFPENPVKTSNDMGKEPFLNFKHIKSYQGLPYATGEIYYCNWPQVVSRSGNKKMFLDTTWAHPFEQTWMSYIYQETIRGNIRGGVLLATPTEHDRFEFYPKEERKES